MNDSVLSPDLAELARRHGVATEYWDWQGEHVTVSADAIHSVLAALEVDTSTPEAVSAAIAETEVAPWRRRVPPARVVTVGESATVAVHVPHGDAVRVWVELEETGEHRDLAQVDRWVDPRQVDGALVGEATFALPQDLPTGWHTLSAEHDGEVASGRLVVTPARLQLPTRVAAHGAAGLMNQLYSVRSRRSWGVGDLGDVAELGAWAARTLDTDFMLINPVHAAEPMAPLEASPYLPTSRRFVNPVYVRVEDVPEYAELPAADRARVVALADRARALNVSDEIDRDTAWTLKEQALRILFGRPMSIRRAALFEAYCEREGRGLVDFATWWALVRTYGADEGDWPSDVSTPGAPGTVRVREELGEEVSFAMWLQWVLDTQLATAQRELTDAGMSIGVVQDLAVGVHPRGADRWALGDVFASGITVGAPPDPYNQRGQDWSQPPWRPDRLEALAYAPFRDMVRAALRHSGGLRIDHVIGLFRLWWVPAGGLPLDGTYVRYDHDALIGILMLEAQRAGAIIVGEDLGTVEPWVRDHLAERGILGTSILWFENTDDGTPRAPEAYRRLCLASVTTHDLPPTAGYLTGEHMRIREDLDLFTRPVEVERAEDEAARERMLRALRMRGLVSDLGGEEVELEDLVEALHRYVGASPAALVGIAVPDLVGDRRAMNQPGTHLEYPNWRLSLAGPDRRPVMFEDLVSSGLARRLAASVDRGDHHGTPDTLDEVLDRS